MIVRYKPSFVREFKKLSAEIREEALEKIDLFRNIDNHQKLKVHKLNGRLKDFYSFSITYSHRIVFEYEAKDEVVFVAVGSHDIYR